MPAVPLLTATIETALNKVLSLDPDAAPKLSQLQGKRLVVELDDLQQRFALVFSSKVDVLALADCEGNNFEGIAGVAWRS